MEIDSESNAFTPSSSRYSFVPFRVHKLTNPSVSWINFRWFLENGIDVYQADALRGVHTWILEKFAWIVMDDTSRGGVDPARTEVHHADRYGGSGSGVLHGGSGRVSTVGPFQVKGVGATPLVADDVKWDYSSGYASLEECLREAIYSEVCDPEFPCGAVPVVAVIDTGTTYSHPDTERIEAGIRRGLLVRPSVTRPAHFERAPLFKRGRCGFVNDQQHDVARVREMIRAKASGRESHFDLNDHIVDVCKQIAFSNFHRLFPGGYFSSNMTIKGEVLDFGNMHYFEDWACARILANTSPFGRDIFSFVKAIPSLAFHLNKFSCAASQHDPILLMNKAREARDSFFSLEAMHAFAVGSPVDAACGKEVASMVREYFDIQQRSRTYYKFGEVFESSPSTQDGNWILSSLKMGPSKKALQEGGRTLGNIRDSIKRHFGRKGRLPAQLRLSFGTACRYLAPRSDLHRGSLMRKLQAEVDSRLKDLRSPMDMQDYLDNLISSNRRHWKNCPTWLVHDRYYHRGGSTVVVATDSIHGGLRLWVEGVHHSGRLFLFGKELEASSASSVMINGGRWSCLLNLGLAAARRLDHSEVEFWGQVVTVPPVSYVYAKPSAHWLSM